MAGSLPRCSTRTRRSPGVTSGALRPEIAVIAVPSTTDGGNMVGDDFDVTMRAGVTSARAGR